MQLSQRGAEPCFRENPHSPGELEMEMVSPEARVKESTLVNDAGKGRVVVD